MSVCTLQAKRNALIFNQSSVWEASSTEHHDTRSAILDAAIALMYKQGYEATTMRDIATDIGITSGSLYHHFVSKQAILVEVLETAMKQLTSEALGAIGKAEDDPHAKLRALIHAHIMFHAKNQKAVFLTDNELRSLDPDNLYAIVALRDTYEALVQDVLQSMPQTLTGAELRVGRIMVVRLCSSVAVWYRPVGELTLAQIADIMSRFILRALDQRQRSGAPQFDMKG